MYATVKRSLYKIGEARSRDAESGQKDRLRREHVETDKAPAPDVPAPHQANVPPIYQHYPEDEIDLVEYWQVLVQYKKLILLLTLTSTLLALLAAFLMTPVYRAEVLLAPVSHDEDDSKLSLLGASQFGDLLARTGIPMGSGGNQISLHIATLKSRLLTTAFIESESLMPVLFPESLEATAEGRKNSFGFFSDEAPTLWAAFNLFDREIRSIDLDRSTGLLTLAIEWQDPELAAAWANNLVQRVNHQLSSQAIEEGRTSISYLKKQLAETSSVEVQQAIYRLIEAETKEIMLANVQEEYAFKVIDPAVAPQKPIKPQRTLIVTLGFLLGLIAALFIAFFHSAITKHKKGHDNQLRES